MILLRAIEQTSAELNAGGRQRLLEEAIRFRLAGGVVTLADWAVLTAAERDALVLAAATGGVADAVEQFLDEATA